MWKLITIVLGLTLMNCSTQSLSSYGSIPSQSQLEWHEMEYFGLICYGLNTYTEQEWAYGDVDPILFKPSHLDTDQWARVASDAGLKGLILVAKHHDGFCLWPSKYTKYSVASTPWKNGKGDVLGDLSKSCKKYKLKLGVYLSPWDRNHADYGKPEYVEYYYKQLEELMTEYGDVFEFWIDGANGGTGYYGGAKETRRINRETYYGYQKIFDIVYKHQPNAIIFSDVGPGSRWVGNEKGIASETNWNTITTAGQFPGTSNSDYNKKLGTGEFGGKKWIPAEADTPLLWPKAWYYHTGKKPRSLSNMVNLYYTSIGRGASLNLGLPITPSGLISEADKKVLLSFKNYIDRAFKNNLVEEAKIKASNTRKGKHFSVKKMVDSDTKSYWATKDNVKEASLIIEFDEEKEFNQLLLQEAISLGQRVHEFKIEYEKDGKFILVVNGTTIGYKRVVHFDTVKSSRVRINLKTKATCLTLSNIGIYNAPLLVDDPKPAIDINGKLTFKKNENISIYYSIDESSEFKKYEDPIKLPLGGMVHSYAKDNSSDYKTDIISNEFGIAKSQWKIISVNEKSVKDSEKCIDNDPKSFFVYSNKSKSNEIIIDLGKKEKVNGFSYLTRQDGKKEGTVYEYECYLSLDGKNWSTAVAQGTFSNIENNPIKRTVKFDQTINGKFFKLVSKSTIKGDTKFSIAEIEIFATK